MNFTTLWLIIFVACIALEIVSMGLTSVWFAGGAVIAAVCSALGAPIWLQSNYKNKRIILFVDARAIMHLYGICVPIHRELNSPASIHTKG